MFDITAIGEILIDFTPGKISGTNEPVFIQNPGGAPANVLATIAKFGGKTAFIGKVGNDVFGDFLIKILKENNIDTSSVVKDVIHNTTLAFVSLNENGDREFSFYRGFGADIFLTKDDVNPSLIKNSKLFHFGSLSLTNEPAASATDYALKTAADSGCMISFDPNYRKMLWKSETEAVNVIKKYIPLADILKVSREEAVMITGETDVSLASDMLTGMGPKLVLLTDGTNGSFYASNGIKGHVPAISVKTIDTTGAGDIFFGTFLYEVLRRDKTILDLCREDLETCIKKASEIAAVSTTKKGAIPSIPCYNYYK